jgi:hypothetical protein
MKIFEIQSAIARDAHFLGDCPGLGEAQPRPAIRLVIELRHDHFVATPQFQTQRPAQR